MQEQLQQSKDILVCEVKCPDKLDAQLLVQNLLVEGLALSKVDVVQTP